MQICYLSVLEFLWRKNHRWSHVREKRPVQDVHTGKETYIFWKETYVYENRPINMKIDLRI